MPIASAAVDEAATYAKLTRRIVPFFCCCFLAAYIDRVNVGFAKLQMLGELHWNETVYGLGAGLFFAGYIACEIPSNLILQRVGARLWIARIMVTWGLISGAMVLVATPGSYYLLRLLLGVAEAGFMPGVLFYLATLYPQRRRSGIIAVFMLGIPLSSAIGGPLSGAIMTRLQGAAQLSGWQWLFLIEAIPSIALGIAAYFLLPRSIAAIPWLGTDEKAMLARNLDADRHEDETSLLLDAIRDRRIWLVGIVDGAILLGLYAVIFWLPTIIRNTGVTDPLKIGLLTTIPHVAAIVAMIAVGRDSDRSRERRWHVALPMMIGAAGLALSTLFAGKLALTVIVFSIANAGIVSAIPPLWCIPGTFLRGRAAAAGLALAGSVANLAGFFSTYLVGWLLDLTHTASAALLVFAGCLVLGAGLVLTLSPETVDR